MRIHVNIICLALILPVIGLAEEKEEHAQRMLAEAECALAPTGTVVAAAWPDTNILFHVAWWPRADLIRVKSTLQDVLAGKTDLWNRNAYAIHHNSFTILASGKAVLAENTIMRVLNHWRGAVTSNQQERVVSHFTVDLPDSNALKAPLPETSLRVLVETRQSDGRKQTHYYVENEKLIYAFLSSVGVNTRRSQQASAPYRSQPRDARLQPNGER